ncbi:MAG: efflux transporter outer membrane subunit [Alphaproteobacteria bacterium]
MFAKHFALTLMAGSALAGCATISPDYSRPEAPIANSLPLTSQTAPSTPLYWNELVTSPELSSLIEMGLDENRDLRIATANVRLARAQLNLSKADRLPTLSASGSATEGGRIAGDRTTGSAIYSNSTIAQIGVSSYELDFFGRLENREQSAFKSYLSTEAGARSVRISIVAAIMDAWMQLAADQALLDLAQETADNQKESLELTQGLLDAGVANELDTRRASASMQSALADVAQSQALIMQDKNTLELLVGQNIPDSTFASANLAPYPVRTNIPVGMASSVLLNRPDIIAAEAKLKAANADISVARAAYFPTISLTGSAGGASFGLESLFNGGGALGWSFGPSISLPIFDAGRRDANLESARALEDLALAQYEQSIQTAFKEAADALAVASTIDARLAALDQFTEDTGVTLFLSRERFKEGLDDYLSVLDAQRQDFTGRQQQILVQLQKGQNTTALYRALGSWAE